MKILLEELGDLGQLELFRVQLAERLRCDVKRISITQICRKPPDIFDSFQISMEPIDEQHQGLHAQGTFEPDKAYDVLHNLADCLCALRERLKFQELESKPIRQIESVITGDPDKLGGIKP